MNSHPLEHDSSHRVMIYRRQDRDGDTGWQNLLFSIKPIGLLAYPTTSRTFLPVRPGPTAVTTPTDSIPGGR